MVLWVLKISMLSYIFFININLTNSPLDFKEIIQMHHLFPLTPILALKQSLLCPKKYISLCV